MASPLSGMSPLEIALAASIRAIALAAREKAGEGATAQAVAERMLAMRLAGQDSLMTSPGLSEEERITSEKLREANAMRLVNVLISGKCDCPNCKAADTAPPSTESVH